MFDQFVTAYLTELKSERDLEREMEEAAAKDAADEAAAAAAAAAAEETSSSSSGSSGGEQPAAADAGEASSSGLDVSDTWSDEVLMRRIKALREAERGQVGEA